MKRVPKTSLSQRAVGAEKTVKEFWEKHFGACGRTLDKAIRTARLSRKDLMKRAVWITVNLGGIAEVYLSSHTGRKVFLFSSDLIDYH